MPNAVLRTIAIDGRAAGGVVVADRAITGRDMPRLAKTDEEIQLEKVLINRLAVSITGAMLLFLALRRMEHREKLLS